MHPSLIKIACVCVTQAKRAPVFGISAASFASQDYPRKLLIMSLPDADGLVGHVESLQRVWLDSEDHYSEQTIFVAGDDGVETVPGRLDHCCQLAWDLDCHLVTIWDDDDIKPHNWLDMLLHSVPREAVQSIGSHACVAGVTQGWFVNLRTLNGVFIQLPHFWGGSLTFNKQAWESAGGFHGRPMPGYDRSFVEALCESGQLVSRTMLDIARDAAGHVAFVHGDNVATKLHAPGEMLHARIHDWYGSRVWNEIARTQEWMVKRRIFPAFTGGN